MRDHINKIKEGYSEGIYKNNRCGISKSVFNGGKSFKIYAEELQGNDFVSLNYYITSTKEHLKPCEMSEQKLVNFIKYVELIKVEKNR